MTDVALNVVDDETNGFLLSQEMGQITTIDRLTPPVGVGDELEARIVEAALRCTEQWGIAKTTVDDIARAAGISRATLYRTFPGGKDVVFDALVRHEAARFFHTVTDQLDQAATLADLLTVGIVEAARFLSEHRALRYLLDHEPERILPEFTFDRLARTLAVATAFTAPHLRRFVLDDERAAAHAEWVVRVLLSYAIDPSPALPLTDPAAVRRFATTYLVPAVQAAAAPTEPPKER